ncbi:MAG: ribbon-helix-helix protein, CopG family [Anaerolineales bacterium]|nr:ribbon-helix-helix protein, CopG family [Anaerolineales bacterium]
MSSVTLRPVSVKLDADELMRLKTLAEARQRKPHFLMKEALRQYLDREERRESFHREAMDNWREYQETGLHLIGGEVAAWLDTWGTDAEQEAPACHE